MDGAEPDKWTQESTARRKRILANGLAWLSLVSFVINAGGCAATSNAWRNLTSEPPGAKCSCGGCTCAEQVAVACSVHGCPVHGSATSTRRDQNESNRAAGMQNQQPSPPHETDRSQQPSARNQRQPEQPGFHDNSHSQDGFDDQANYGSGPGEYPHDNYPPAADSISTALKEVRAQVQVISTQMSDVRTVQESMRTNQETLQKSLESQLMEVKLQQMKLQQETSERSHLERERELLQELEKNKQREISHITALSQMLQSGIAPDGSVSKGLTPTPNSTVRSTQEPAAPTIPIPPVN